MPVLSVDHHGESFVGPLGEPLLEVRCCCQPTRLLGYLPYPDRAPFAGARVMFPLRGDRTRVGRAEDGHEQVVVLRERLTLEVGTMEDRQVEVLAPTVLAIVETTRLAFNSEDTPIETLRLVKGFIEAPARKLRFPGKDRDVVVCFARTDRTAGVVLEGVLRRLLGAWAAEHAYVCPECGMVSFNPNDQRERYCGRCHVFEGELEPEP